MWFHFLKNQSSCVPDIWTPKLGLLPVVFSVFIFGVVNFSSTLVHAQTENESISNDTLMLLRPIKPMINKKSSKIKNRVNKISTDDFNLNKKNISSENISKNEKPNPNSVKKEKQNSAENNNIQLNDLFPGRRLKKPVIGSNADVVESAENQLNSDGENKIQSPLNSTDIHSAKFGKANTGRQIASETPSENNLTTNNNENINEKNFEKRPDLKSELNEKIIDQQKTTASAATGSEVKHLSLDVAGFMLNQDSKSGFSPRNYNSQSMGYKIAPTFNLDNGIFASISFASTMISNIDQINAKGSTTNVRQDWTTIGVLYKKQNSDLTNNIYNADLMAKLVWSEYKFNLLNEDNYHSKLKTTGFGAGVVVKIPSGNYYNWIFEGLLFPSLSHAETGGYSSGNSPETTRMDFSLGGEFTISKTGQLFYEIKSMFEKNRFASTTTQADPETGLSPSRVSVQNWFYMFSLGYRWGQ